MKRYAPVPLLWKKMSEAGICGYWYSPQLITRLIKQKKARIPKSDSGRIKMTETMMNDFVKAFSPGGKMRWP